MKHVVESFLEGELGEELDYIGITTAIKIPVQPQWILKKRQLTQIWEDMKISASCDRDGQLDRQLIPKHGNVISQGLVISMYDKA